MSLLNQANPIEIFSRCGERFLASPSPISGMEFDDAVVALKRHANVALGDEQLAASLAPFARLIRDQEIETLRPLFEALRDRLQARCPGP